ncbi:hypothetical protein AB0M54_17855 [Actinoplanes sp. NPDC051470]|uniref:hypothetical protein n=1 Tax=Actinoplanes sp. NPDC051470 TaxID=3157224 RepID=UPI00342A1467
MRIRTLCAVAAATLLIPLLAGCGEPAGNETPAVATLRSAPAASASAPAAQRERPVLGPDDGKAEYDRYMVAHRKCLTDLGVTVPDDHEKPRIRPEVRAAAEKCDLLVPETWQDRERRIDPQYEDRLRETAQCLRAKGHNVTVGGDPVSILYGDGTGANQAYDDLQACEKQVFKESLKKYRGAGNAKTP